MSAQLPRREFVRNAAVAVSSLALSGPASTAYAAGPQPWFDRPMRWAQLTLVENDPGQYDLHFWLDYFRRTHSDAACLSAGGCVAFYPTQDPAALPQPWMKDSDPFGDLVAGCRKMNMVVLARTDPHAVHQDVYDAHPDWIAVDAEGKKRRHWAMPELWVTCALGPYNFEFMTEVTREIVAAVPGGRDLQQPLGRLGHVLLRALPREFPRGQRARSAAYDESAGPGARAPTSRGSSSGSSTCGTCGTPRSARSIPPPVTFPIPAAAPSASST